MEVVIYKRLTIRLLYAVVIISWGRGYNCCRF